MLVTLSIKNFILIESLSLDFTKGFYVISGETGAGKSILLDSILFVLGHKFDSKIIKPNTDYASVSAEFKVSDEISHIAREHGIELSDNIIIKRQQYQNGRKKFFINDEPVTVKLVELLASFLLEIHGQDGYSKLLSPSNHIKILDNFGDLETLKEVVEAKYKEYKQIESDIESIEKDKNHILREIDYLEHVVLELKSKCPNEGEEEVLSDKRIRLRGQEKRGHAIKEMENILGESSIGGKISSMQKIAHNQDETFNILIHNLDQLQIYLDEMKNSLSNLAKETIEENLEDIEVRLFEIRDLSRKYKMPSNELSAHLEKSELELQSLKGKIDNFSNLAKDLKVAKDKYVEFATILSAKRKKVAIDFETKVCKELAPLNMANCKWFVEVSEKVPASNGIDNVRFTAITNPGMDAAPIDKIASGGEMARMMLAVKLSIFDKDSARAIIFDEIDTGLGGKVADSVGERLRALSKCCQTIVITHQPQVASKADYNILVTKHNGISKARILDEAERNKEIARMISGVKVTDKAIDAAKELMGQ